MVESSQSNPQSHTIKVLRSIVMLSFLLHLCHPCDLFRLLFSAKIVPAVFIFLMHVNTFPPSHPYHPHDSSQKYILWNLRRFLQPLLPSFSAAYLTVRWWAFLTDSFSWNSSATPAKCQVVPHSRPGLFPPTSFPIRYSYVVLLFNTDLRY